MKRCLNLDWLELYCLEPASQPHSAEYYIQSGFIVQQRDYGTRIYEEMFKLLDKYGYPFIEIRRRPKSGGVLPVNACHVRFDNRYCYLDNAGEVMQQFCDRYSLQVVSISRLDVCLDFEYFDKGDDPQRFVKRYIGHKYAKINQSEAAAHFDDQWERRDFNSLSWGAKTSDIYTKLYNKTLELYDPKLGAFRKPYIIQAWFHAGLIDDPVKVIKKDKDGTEYRPVIWRLEFSIRSNVKGWLKYQPDGDTRKIRSVRHTLPMYSNREALLPIFDLLQQHYFHFKKHVPGKSKYLCPDKVLFDFSSQETFYKVVKPASPSKPDAMIMRLKRYLTLYNETQFDKSIKDAITLILGDIIKKDASRLVGGSFTHKDYLALQYAIQQKLKGVEDDPSVLMELYKRLSKEAFA